MQLKLRQMQMQIGSCLYPVCAGNHALGLRRFSAEPSRSVVVATAGISAANACAGARVSNDSRSLCQ
jgi:hypothetical protein